MTAEAEVCRAHHDAQCPSCSEHDDALWAHPRDLGVMNPAEQLKTIIDWLCDDQNADRLTGINSDVYWAAVESGGTVASAVIELLARRVALENCVEDMRELIARF